MKFNKIIGIRSGYFRDYAEVAMPGYILSTGVPAPVSAPVSVLFTAINYVTIRKDGDVALVEGRGSELWLHERGLHASPRSFRMFQWTGPAPIPDICSYCGHDNGPHGESRVGFDCGSCMSN